MKIDPVIADTNRYEWELNMRQRRESSIDELEAKFWSDLGERLALLEEIGMSERDELVSALQDGDYRRFAGMIDIVGREKIEKEFEDRAETQKYNRGAARYDEKHR